MLKQLAQEFRREADATAEGILMGRLDQDEYRVQALYYRRMLRLADSFERAYHAEQNGDTVDLRELFSG